MDSPGAFIIVQTPSIGIAQAHQTLLNAARFLGSSLGRSARVPIEGRYRARVVGNGLRELDRFLSILLDESATAAGWDAGELRMLARLRNTSAKLSSVRASLGLEASDEPRLRALGRCRDLLFHCDGVVRRGDTRDMQSLTPGWPIDGRDGLDAALQIGERLTVSPAELSWICAFYVRIGNELAAANLRNA